MSTINPEDFMVVELLDRGEVNVAPALFKSFFKGSYAKMEELTLRSEFGQYDTLRGKVQDIIIRLFNFRRVYINVSTGEVTTP